MKNFLISTALLLVVGAVAGAALVLKVAPESRAPSYVYFNAVRLALRGDGIKTDELLRKLNAMLESERAKVAELERQLLVQDSEITSLRGKNQKLNTDNSAMGTRLESVWTFNAFTLYEGLSLDSLSSEQAECLKKITADLRTQANTRLSQGKGDQAEAKETLRQIVLAEAAITERTGLAYKSSAPTPENARKLFAPRREESNSP